GYVVQGRGDEKAKKLLEDATALEEAGCSSLVLEMIPAPLAEVITRSVSIPTIGIGAGAGCDGQVLVCYDLLGMNADFQPRFVKRYAELAEVIEHAAQRFRDEVRGGEFPDAEHSFEASPATGGARRAEHTDDKAQPA